MTSSEEAAYVLPDLPVGPYRLDVSKTGFTTYVQTGIVLQVATNPTIDITLKVEKVSEQVQVEANATLVESTATGSGFIASPPTMSPPVTSAPPWFIADTRLTRVVSR